MSFDFRWRLLAGEDQGDVEHLKSRQSFLENGLAKKTDVFRSQCILLHHLEIEIDLLRGTGSITRGKCFAIEQEVLTDSKFSTASTLVSKM